MTAYYNEHDAHAAQWLRNLIAAGHIAPGDVDERSIEDVRPAELVGYTQCHFFAGIGIWSYALRAAGWPDDRAVWTGSCPCQPFSAAGEGLGFADERHLWPTWFHLIAQCRPPTLFGEQVASKDTEPWIDLVCDDLESLDYACGAVAFPAAGIGAPNIRDRLYWVGHAERAGLARSIRLAGVPGRAGRADQGQAFERTGVHSLRLANPERIPGGREAEPADHRRPQSDGPADRAGRCGGAPGGLALANEGQWGPRRAGAERAGGPHPEPSGPDIAGGMADTDGGNAGAEREQRSGQQRQQPQDGGTGRMAHTHRSGRQEQDVSVRPAQQGQAAAIARGLADRHSRYPLEHGSAPGPVNGFWRDADWLCCRDGRWRPVEPGTFPLATGIAGRVGQLRAYGNGLNAEAAISFIECVAAGRADSRTPLGPADPK